MKKRKRNLLLGPVITIIALTILIIIISTICNIFGVSAEVTTISNNMLETTNQTVKSLFSEEGFKYFFSSPVDSFKTFEPLVLIIISLMAISIGKSSGLLKAIFSPMKKLKPSIVTFLTLFVGIISSFLGVYSYIVLVPLVAVIYQYMGRNSVLGIFTAFIGITLGYGAGIIFNFDDYRLGLLTSAAAKIDVDESYVFNAWSNLYVMLAGTVLLSIIGTVIIETVLKPKVKAGIKEEDELVISKKGLALSSIAFIFLVAVFMYLIIPGMPYSGLLLDQSEEDYIAQLFGGGAPFTDAFIFVFLIIMMVCSGIYGFISKNIKSTNDFSVGLSKEFDNLGYMFVLMFFVSLLISILEFTNLGEVVGALLVSFMSSLEFTGLPLIITMMLVIIIMSFLIPDAVTKWTITAPILVPLFMKANITPDFTQMIFKAADSIGKGLTPFFIYFIVMLAFVEKYNNNDSNKITVFGTLKLLRPTVLLFSVIWFLLIIGWFIIGLPIGPETGPTL